jgi:hypothetical protein
MKILIKTLSSIAQSAGAPMQGRGLARRRNFIATACGLLFINGCGAKIMEVSLNVQIFNYLDRPIFEVLVDGKVDEIAYPYPNMGGRTTVGVSFMLGPKTVSWRLDGPEGAPRNGETVRSKNIPRLNEVVPGAKYLAVHIYPDDTVELLTSITQPDVSPRGQAEISRMRKESGK